jgi:hypothetical protein
VSPLADSLVIVNTAESWDLVVPEDAAELLAQFRRHGVRPGTRLWVVEPSGDVPGDPDEWHRTVSALLTAVAVISSATGEVAEALRAAIGPQLGEITRARHAVVHGRELDDAERNALATVARALEDALRHAGRIAAQPVTAEAERPRRRLRFTGLIEGPPDLATRTDEYLAQGFGRD